MRTKNNSTEKHIREFAIDKLFICFIIVGIMCIDMAFVTFDENDVGFFVFLLLLGLFFVSGGIFTTPYGYFFDKEGVSARYVFYPKERYLWRNIYYIMITDGGSSSTRSPIFDMIFSRVFEIGGEVEGKKRFYMNGHIRKSRRIRKQIEKYWDGTITKEGRENKKKSKKTKELKLLSDEVAALERKVRAESKQWMEEYREEARSMGLELRCEYIYITPDLDEKNSRPNSPYKYTMLTEICKVGEKDEDKTVLIDADLLTVRLGKRAYRGIENKKAEGEFHSIMRETLDEIKKNGIEVYCGEL